jgi:hypothetical protein
LDLRVIFGTDGNFDNLNIQVIGVMVATSLCECRNWLYKPARPACLPPTRCRKLWNGA